MRIATRGIADRPAMRRFYAAASRIRMRPPKIVANLSSPSFAAFPGKSMNKHGK
jgi:hypothetical protein